MSYTVYLSSTLMDLEHEREAVRQALSDECVVKHSYVASENALVDSCLQDVANCDAYILILGMRYGYVPERELENPSNLSITELEYQHATDKPRLVFIKDEGTIPFALTDAKTREHPLERIEGFRKRAAEDQRAAVFKTADDLKLAVVKAFNTFKDDRDRSIAAGASGDSMEGLISIPEPQWHPDRSPPGALLRADQGVVPFHRREHELQSLQEWCNNGAAIGIRLYTGKGGTGKTRLALEACKRLRQDGWLAGFIDHRLLSVPPERWRELGRQPRSLFLVLDYAETCRPILVDLLHKLREVSPKCIRLMLLARHAGEWWDDLKTEGGGVGDLLIGPATLRFSLSALASTTEERTASYRSAINALANILSKPVPKELPDNLEAPYFERVLLLHMTALASIEGVKVTGEDGILDYVLRRERRFWSTLAKARGLDPIIQSGIGRAMAAITLGGGATGERHAIELLQALKFFDGQPQAVLHAVAGLLHDSYSGAKWIEPVQPDLLGEHLVQVELENNGDELLNLVLGTADE